MQLHSQSAADVTDEDIKLFRRTLIARRFPQLRELSDKEVVELILADRKATGRRLEAPRKTYPKTEYESLVLDKTTKPPIPFVPVNAVEAKETIKRKPAEAFIAIHSPYDANHQDFVEDKTNDESKRHPMAPFYPTCPPEAKSTIQVKYYLNSATEEGQQAEKDALRTRTFENMSNYLENYSTMRSTVRARSKKEQQL